MTIHTKISFIKLSILHFKRFKSALLICFFLLFVGKVSAQVTVQTGSFIINMGVTPQTIGNGLKPYGMLYDLVKFYGVTAIWSIDTTKVKDGIDFSHNGVDYKSGAFIVPAEYRTPTVNARIAFWQSQGVVGNTTVSPITVPVFKSFNIRNVPRWTMDKQNGKLALPYFTNAGIPSDAYGGSDQNLWKDPADLDCCDDLFVMPHADPIWSTHQRLLSWNLECKGGIWAACHAPSALENMVNPANRSQQANFLTQKDPAWTGTSGNYTLSNSLILWGSHSAGTPPYSFNPAMASDPTAQFMGSLDAATQNGSEQIYMPRQGIVANASTYSASAVARWNPSANIIVYDPTQVNVTNPNLSTLQNVATVLVYGRGFEDEDRGYVMYEAGHSHAKASAPANIAAQRAFFNFGLLVANDRGVFPTVDSIPSTMVSGVPEQLTYELPLGVDSNDYTTVWSSNCGGTFSPNANQKTVTFTPPIVFDPTTCVISVEITDPCGRTGAGAQSVLINNCSLTVDKTINNVSCFGESDGQIVMDINGSPGPFNWSWTRVYPSGSGSGTGDTISGLSIGTYNVTVTDGGACSTSFTQLITQPTLLTVTPTVNNYLCVGTTGSINLTVNGGTPNYTYDWSGPNGYTNNTKDIADLLAGIYNVTVTDANGCELNLFDTITGPLDSLKIDSVVSTNITCFGDNNGTINTYISGGTPGYTYLWNDGNTNANRTNLSPGNYTLIVTDANGCQTNITVPISQPQRLILSRTKIDPTCPPGGEAPLDENGSINLTVTGGVGPYTYAWSTLNGSGLVPTDEDQSDLTIGTYTVLVTDANGCTATINTTLENLFPLPLQPNEINND